MNVNKTDIICTIGPSSWDIEILKKMVLGGMTIMRLNGAFADEAQIDLLQSSLFQICSDLGLKPFVDVKLMMDTKGVEIRLNKFNEIYTVKVGEIIEIGSSAADKIYPVTYPELYRDLKIGTILKIDKGKVSMEVKNIDHGKIKCMVINGGDIVGGKGVIPVNTHLTNPVVTDTDLTQIEFALKNKWNYIALSMISSKNQLNQVREKIDSLKILSNTKIISKIETVVGVNNIEEIASNCDGIMIGRGDLAVDSGFERVPELQEILQNYCTKNTIYHIVATEMLESMLVDEFPSNADVSDITKAIKQGCNALMLSNETTQGEFPIECVKVLSKIINYNSK